MTKQKKRTMTDREVLEKSIELLQDFLIKHPGDTEVIDSIRYQEALLREIIDEENLNRNSGIQ